MPAIDTNALLRLFVTDNEIQSQKVRNLLRKQEAIFVSVPVICETIWVLESFYHLKKDEIIATVEKILKTDRLEVEHTEVIWYALSEFRDASMGLADCIIGEIAKSKQSGPVFTFDKKAAKSPLFKLI